MAERLKARKTITLSKGVWIVIAFCALAGLIAILNGACG